MSFLTGLLSGSLVAGGVRLKSSTRFLISDRNLFSDTGLLWLLQPHPESNGFTPRKVTIALLLVSKSTNKSLSMHALAYTYSSSLSPSTSSSSPSTLPLNSPPPASTRINHPTPLSTNLTRAWNAHIEHAFTVLHSASDSLADWGRSSFYGLGLGTHSGSKEEKGGLKEELGKGGNGS